MSSNSKTSSKTKKKTSPFAGIVLGIFEDIGPIPKYSHTRIPKEIVSHMVVHGMSAVHGDKDNLIGLFGPLPVFAKKDLRYLIFSFVVTASNTKDVRIAEHGRVCSIFLILKESQERTILNNHLTIEKILQDFITSHWKKETDITKSSLLELYRKINERVLVKEIRAFSYGKGGLIEFEDPQQMLKEGILIIIDLKVKKAYLFLPKELFDSKTRISAIKKIEELNQREYGSQLKIIKYRDYLKFKKILDKHNIQLVK
ncbi:hypothetical protein DRO91_07515 [Candidatus Heimdallarchaeota archaeon]|nr:MAG: hypothetical protein DRO91_07515 [Candidatus Heimdallarchaeota archaeon]